jgi:DNA mismatch repair protein MutL
VAAVTERPRVAILPDAVADQIAAGEVVERPASVVKELVENALDAGASHIRISIENGGKTRVEVADDGTGMGREDAVLALDRHATSKIRQAQDLVGVATYGFRGEALPAVASVSRFTLTTSHGEGEATGLIVSGGRLERVESTARQRGTTVEVRNLFFNTPARRKFLRSTASETRAAVDVVATLALANPATGFELHCDERLRLHAPPGQSGADRLSTVWGHDLVATLVPVSFATGAFRIEGFVQRPSDARPTGRRTQLLVNGRPFRDPFLIRAAEAGYRSAINPGDRPSLYLAIEVAKDEVDVNVHPAKLEVRFRDRFGLEQVVESAVREALGHLIAAAPLAGPPAAADLIGWGGLVTGPGDARSSSPASEHGAGVTVEVEFPEVAAAGFPYPLFQLFDTYIVYQTPEGLVVTDQHSAHERVLYESILAQIRGSVAPAQRLLLPLTLDLNDEELEAVEQHRDRLARVGFEVDPFGGRAVVVHTVPNPHPRFDAGRCLREMVADLARGRFGGWADPLERFAATFACRAAVKAGERLDDREMRELMVRLLATTLPPHDVHGRATMLQLTREELERRFGRR